MAGAADCPIATGGEIAGTETPLLATVEVACAYGLGTAGAVLTGLVTSMLVAGYPDTGVNAALPLAGLE